MPKVNENSEAYNPYIFRTSILGLGVIFGIQLLHHGLDFKAQTPSQILVGLAIDNSVLAGTISDEVVQLVSQQAHQA
jgi:hypothetical protein